MAWFRCGFQKTVDKTHIEDTNQTNQPTPIPTPVPEQGRSKPDRLFSHPIVPLGSQNYRGQYYYEVPIYSIVWNPSTQENELIYEMRDVIGGYSYSEGFTVSIQETFIPALGSVFDTPGVHTVKYICDIYQTSRYTGDNMTIHTHREVSQDIVVVNHGTVVEQATRDCPCDIYSDGYCFFRPIQTDNVWWNYHTLMSGDNIVTTDRYNYVHYYPKQNQSVAVNKISCLPWRVRSLGTGTGEYSYLTSTNPVNWTSDRTWSARRRDDTTPAIYNQYTAFLTGDGVTPIDISEFSIWSCFYWMERIDSLFSNVGSVTNYQTLANWNVYDCNFLETFAYVGFSSDMFACIKDWNIKATRAMQGMFISCTNLTHTNFLATWNVSHCKNYSDFFNGCTSLTDLSGLANWNVMGAYFTNMFSNCSSLANLTPLSNWGTKYHDIVYYNISNNPNRSKYCGEDGVLQYGSGSTGDRPQLTGSPGFSRMFYNCTSLITLNGVQTLTSAYTPSSVDPTKDYRTEIPTTSFYTSEMFRHCTSLTNISALSSWTVYNLLGMSITTDTHYSSGWHTSTTVVRGVDALFAECHSLADISPLQSWDTSAWIGLNKIFSCCISLVDISPIANWDLQGCRYLNGVFDNCYSITSFSPLSGWGSTLGSNLRAFGGGFFFNCQISSFGFLSTWNVPNLKSIGYLFTGARLTINDLTGLSVFDNCRFQYLGSCFTFAEHGSIGSTGINHTSQQFEEDANHRYYFSSYDQYQGVTNISWTGSRLYSLHGIENWKGSQIKSLNMTFGNNTYLYDISALANWSFSVLQDVANIFKADYWLSDISAVSGWDTSTVISMSYAFNGTSVEDISPLNGWDKSNVTIYKEWVSYQHEWRYNNYAAGMVWTRYRKGYSASLGETIIVLSYNANAQTYRVFRLSDNTTLLLTEVPIADITFSTLANRDAASASNWNFVIPGDYDQGLNVIAPNPTVANTLLDWDNIPTWN